MYFIAVTRHVVNREHIPFSTFSLSHVQVLLNRNNGKDVALTAYLAMNNSETYNNKALIQPSGHCIVFCQKLRICNEVKSSSNHTESDLEGR